MEQQNNQRFPEQNEPSKLHGTTGETEGKEKYIRDSGKIEDYPPQDQPAKMNPDPEKKEGDKSEFLTDVSGEEEKEDYINTDERKRDLERRGLI